jgi:hypothetical protein
VEHRQQGAEASGKVVEAGTYPNDVASTRGTELGQAMVFHHRCAPPMAIVDEA